MTRPVWTTARLVVAPLLAILLFVVGSSPLPRLLVDGSVARAVAYTSLGLASGERCLSGSPLRYVPGHDRPDSTFVAERPERAVEATLAGRRFIADQVEVSLGEGTAVVRGRVVGPDGQEESRTFRLLARLQRQIWLDLPWNDMFLCTAGLEHWQVAVRTAVQ